MFERRADVLPLFLNGGLFDIWKGSESTGAGTNPRFRKERVDEAQALRATCSVEERERILIKAIQGVVVARVRASADGLSAAVKIDEIRQGSVRNEQEPFPV